MCQYSYSNLLTAGKANLRVAAGEALDAALPVERVDLLASWSMDRWYKV
jgi:hypothetical protein